MMKKNIVSILLISILTFTMMPINYVMADTDSDLQTAPVMEMNVTDVIKQENPYESKEQESAKYNLNGKWIKDSIGWRYTYEDGTYERNGFKNISGHTYYFSLDGYIVTGWKFADTNWYYFDQNGYMLTDWQYINGEHYYFNSEGVMASDEMIGEYYVDASGKWIPDKWENSSSGWKYRLGNGSYVKNEFKWIEGNTYHFNSAGYMETGWKNINSNWYYFKSSGVMETGLKRVGKACYYFTDNGIMQTGFNRIDENLFYFDKDGIMQTGHTYIDGELYGFYASGIALDEGWIVHGDRKIAYGTGQGKLVTGIYTIDNKQYRFDNRGYLVDEQGNYILENKGSRSLILAAAREWVGFSEGIGNYTDILDFYNSHRPLAGGYEIKYTDEWCDAFVSACSIQAGATALTGTEVGCGRHLDIFQNKGIWIEDGTITPQPGDFILYNWDKSEQPNDGGPDHIGIVEKVVGGKITCIEGNMSEAVGRREIPIGYGNIRGFARPEYGVSLEDSLNESLPDKWMYDGKGWWYRYAAGGYPKSEFKQIDGQTYYFDKAGYMATGWQKIDSKWYYFDGNGYMATGWKMINRKWHYFDGNGHMRTGWQKIDGRWYYFDENGYMTTGWQRLGTHDYYFYSDGHMAENETIDGKYYVNESGQWVSP